MDRSPTIAFLKWLANVMRDDSDRFIQRYSILFIRTEQLRSGIARVLDKLPQHIPVAAKLAFAITSLITLGMLGLGVLIGSNQTRLLEDQSRLLNTLFAEQLCESVKPAMIANDIAELRDFAKGALHQNNIVGIALLARDGSRIVETGVVPTDNQLKRSSAFSIDRKGASIGWTDPVHFLRAPMTSLIHPVKEHGSVVGHILLSFDRTAIIESKKQTIRMVATTTILMIGLGILASFMLASWLTRPINELIRVSRSIVSGNYDANLLRARRKDEIGMLMQTMNTLSQGLLKKEQVEKIFSRYVSDSVAKRALNDLESLERSPLACEHVQASVIFADIVGFTTLSESASPQEISELLNLYFNYITKVVGFCNGHVDKFIGDCAMIVFGVPEHHRDHAYQSIVCAWMIQELVKRLNRQRMKENKINVQLRIGINSGTMVAGNLGSPERMNYTVVGDAVNIASRLSHAGDPGEIIITEEVLVKEKLQNIVHTEFVDTIKLRGRIQPVSILRVIDIDLVSRPKALKEITRLLQAESAEAG